MSSNLPSPLGGRGAGGEGFLNVSSGSADLALPVCGSSASDVAAGSSRQNTAWRHEAASTNLPQRGEGNEVKSTLPSPLGGRGAGGEGFLNLG